MNIEDKKIAILSITQNGKSLGLNIKNNIKNADLYFIKRDIVENETNVIHINKRLKDFVPEIFNQYDYIIFIMATGIVIRTIAPLVVSKFSDPAILVTDEKGKNIISLLSGHMGGANEMTLYISDLINSNPVITTATDVNEKSSLDMIAKKLNAHIDNFRDNVLKINSMIVNNEKVGLFVDGNYLVDTRGFVLDEKNTLKDIDNIVVISNKVSIDTNLDFSNKNIIKVVPKDIVIGIGCRRDTDSEYMKDSLVDFLEQQNIDINAIKEIGSIDVKKDEKAILNLSKYLRVPFKIFTKEEISQVDYLYDKSEWVKKSVGVYSVAEPVAHLLSNGNLIVKKHKYKGITFSIGRIDI
ncbi:cobalt-precorrin 5A hydrolase [Terrisporobacter mayombei]|nr:cobalt-precorrin 5A hydrolase [Terrisporobacter mayombei]